jgi:hypothetical protein
MSNSHNAAGGPADELKPKPGARNPTLELFMTQLAEFAPAWGKPISPRSHLISDLRFDSLAFRQLGLLLSEHYGVGGLSTSSMRSEGHLTVEEFFRYHVLDVLGIGPGRRMGG